MKYLKGVGFYVILFAVILILVTILSGTTSPQDMKYSTFVNELNNGNVKSVTIEGQTAEVALYNDVSEQVLTIHTFYIYP